MENYTLNNAWPIILSWLLFTAANAEAQEKTQELRGKVTDQANLAPITNAEVFAIGAITFSAATDSGGVYQLQLPTGKYNLLIQHPQYSTVARENIVVVGAKQQQQDFELHFAPRVIEEVKVVSRDESHGIRLDHWSIQNFAAVFYDPGRVVNSHAGAINIDDGTNHMTVRGASPNYTQWRLEEVEIVNPNHLENAGTLNDRPALNGGGVSLISAQLMNNSAFHFPPYSATQGNALSGIFDMRLRTGNPAKREYIIQASLLGTDISAEGPFSKRSSSSYLVNFRYSTIGLLSKIGVDFGDEKTSFYDVSHILSFPFRSGSLRIFGINGASINTYDGLRDTATLSIQKELQDIKYNSLTHINGLAFTSRLGDYFYVKSVMAYSGKNSRRTSTPVDLSDARSLTEDDKLGQSKVSTIHYIGGRLNSTFNFKIGSSVNYFRSELFAAASALNDTVSGSVNELLVQPFFTVEGHLYRRLLLTAGLHGFFLPVPGYSQLQPRVQLRYILPADQQIMFSYGLSAQTHNPFLSVVNNRQAFLPPTSIHALSLTHFALIKNISVKTEFYHQQYILIPVDTTSGFSAFNYFNEQITATLTPDGSAKVYGADIRLQKTVDALYFIASSSLYRASYSNPGKDEKQSRFGTGYNLFFTAGREQRFRNRPHTWTIDVRGTHRNGFRETSLVTDQYVFDKQLPTYWRIDLRLSLKKNKTNSTVIWAIDLQNVTNRKNTAYHYFDALTNREETKYHLGLIPVLSYKVMF